MCGLVAGFCLAEAIFFVGLDILVKYLNMQKLRIRQLLLGFRWKGASQMWFHCMLSNGVISPVQKHWGFQSIIVKLV